MAVRIFFEYGKQVIMMPVNPPSLKVEIKGQNKTVDIVELGMVNILKGVGLATVELSCFLPTTSLPPYVLTKGDFKAPQFYIDFFKKVRKDRKPMRLVVSDLGINMLVSIEDLSTSTDAQDDDTHYKLSLKEYKSYSSKVVKITKPTNQPNPQAQTSGGNRQKTGFAIGDTVLVTGKWWYNSYGASPFGHAPSGFVGKINFINKGSACPYHVTDLNGGWKGWVRADQLQHR